MVDFSMQISTIGGSSDTEQNADTVIPCSLPDASFVETTVTPLANRDIAFLKSSCSTAILKEIYIIISHIAKTKVLIIAFQ